GRYFVAAEIVVQPAQAQFLGWLLFGYIFIFWNRYCLLAVRFRFYCSGLSFLRQNYGCPCPFKNEMRYPWPRHPKHENTVCHDRRGKTVIFPDEKGSSLNRCGPFFSVLRIDQSHRQYRCDRESDQSYVEEWPWSAELLVLVSKV